MKIIVNGAGGRMGKEVARKIKFPDECVAKVDRYSGELDMIHSLLDFKGDADVIIDFSNPAATAEITEYARAKKIPLLIATTGHSEADLKLIEVAAKEIPVFHSANMSLGVALLINLASQAAKAFPDADIEIVEAHHNRKLDAPSGTALMIAEKIKETREEGNFVFGREGRMPRSKGEIGIHAVRGGNIIGMHEIMIITDTQTLTLKHEAHDRALFAEGAIVAAKFLITREAGLYNMEDMLKSL